MQFPTKSFQISLIGVFTAMSLAVQYLESLLPPPVPGIPVRIGLANLFFLYLLLRGNKIEAFCIAFFRCLLFPVLSGNVSAFLYSCAGTLFSCSAMTIVSFLFRKGLVSPIGVSCSGSFLFQIGQLLVGFCIIGRSIRFYIPWLCLLSVPAGICTGLLCSILLKRLP